MKAITIGSNIASLGAQRQLAKASDSLSQTYERLSSGMRINKASDDAAGLSVADSLKASSRVYTQAIRNVNDGVSYLNIAQGALSNLSDIVIRQKELAEQAASGTYSPIQKVSMQTEANQLVKEYNRIMQSSAFNGIYVLDGTNSNLKIQQGFGTVESTSLDVGKYFGVAAGDGTFQARQAFTTGSTPISVSTGDFNGDGKLDLVTADNGATSVSVLLGNGDGTFQARRSFATGSGPASVSIGDFNGDGKLDLVTADNSTTTLSVLLGNGDGTFQARRSFATGSSPYSVSIGDFNGDGNLDLVSADFGGSAIVLLGNGDGTFKARRSFVTGTSTLSVSVGDFNGDGKLDLVTADNGAASASVLLGNGDGSFKAKQTFGTTGAPRSVSIGDFNGDGNLDFAVANFPGGVSVLIGNGDGTFKAKLAFGTSLNPISVSVGDFNGDGKLDLVTADNGLADASVLLGNGDGSFMAGRTFATGTSPYSVSIGDFNGDGVPDLVTADSTATDVSVLLGNADATGRRNNFEAPFDLITFQGARTALDQTTALLDRISLDIGMLGANQSRLGVSLNTIGVRRENYQAAESRIRDADIASESSALISTQITQQAASAVLAQANLQPQIALKLLRG